MGKIQAKSIFRLVPIIGDLGRFLLASTLKNGILRQVCLLFLSLLFWNLAVAFFFSGLRTLSPEATLEKVKSASFILIILT